MKITCIGNLPKSENCIGSFTGVFAFYLDRELRRLGVELQWAINNSAVKELPKADHILAFGNRWFSHFGGALEMHEHTDGCVCQMAENPRQDCFVDQTFIINTTGGRRCTYVGWAVDPELFYPEKDPYILLDHPVYNEHQDSMMDELLVQARAYKGSLKVYRLLEDGIHPIIKNVEDFKKTAQVPYPEMAAITRRTAIFVVTHRESCGLQCLEAAMSGAVVVYPKGFLNWPLADSIQAIEFDGIVPWQMAEELYERQTVRDSVLHFQWSRPAMKILEFFTKESR
jgi:hypothetical protein